MPRHGGSGRFGAHVHCSVLAAGDRVSGASIHLVDGEYDTGEVIAQLEVPVLPGDTVEVLSRRVLEAEHRLLPMVVQQIATGQRPQPNIGCEYAGRSPQSDGG
ncbi:formyltransferase family protein [Nocardia sp. CA-129566]|uniref:formyltransferase family protein n=1 Tax=Nocardia sp. CA-129566 TaxID=3239976 RepID=UPI003D966980